MCEYCRGVAPWTLAHNYTPTVIYPNNTLVTSLQNPVASSITGNGSIASLNRCFQTADELDCCVSLYDSWSVANPTTGTGLTTTYTSTTCPYSRATYCYTEYPQFTWPSQCSWDCEITAAEVRVCRSSFLKVLKLIHLDTILANPVSCFWRECYHYSARFRRYYRGLQNAVDLKKVFRELQTQPNQDVT